MSIASRTEGFAAPQTQPTEEPARGVVTPKVSVQVTWGRQTTKTSLTNVLWVDDPMHAQAVAALLAARRRRL